MTPTDTANVSSAVADLKKMWPDLKDVDRAIAVHALHGQKVSLRKLAKELGCSASLLRNLDKAAQAPQKDIDLARKGQISTRELVRRAREAKAVRKTQDREAAAAQRAKEALAGCDLICNWIEKEEILSVYGENIIDETRRILAENEANGTLPKIVAPKT